MNEEVGKHKGAVETLLHEKKELSRLLQIVNSQLERHLGALEEAGVDTDRFIQEIRQGQQTQQEQQSQKNQRQSSQGSRRSRGRSDTSGRKKSDQEDSQDFNPL